MTQDPQLRAQPDDTESVMQLSTKSISSNVWDVVWLCSEHPTLLLTSSAPIPQGARISQHNAIVTPH